jgi:ABC-type glycerol-3-phosphate transport system substrate-binding protein
MRRGLGFLVVATVLATCGCAASAPPGPSPDEVRAFQVADALAWWESMFPDEPMPEVQVQEYATPETQDDLVDACTDAFVAGIAGIFARPPTTIELNRAVWSCAAQYPVDPAADHGYLSAAQLEYGYAYLLRRTVPCLRALGYQVTPPPVDVLAGTPGTGLSDALDSGRAGWSPYWSILVVNGDWRPMEEAIESCPPPPGSGWAPVIPQRG